MEKIVTRGLITSVPLDSGGSSVDVWLGNMVARVKMVHNHRSGGLGWRGAGGVAWGS